MLLVGINLPTLWVWTTSRGCHRESSGGLSIFGPGIYSFGKGTRARLSLICQIVLPDSSVMTNYMSVTLTPNLPSVGICSKVLGPDITTWLGGTKALFSLPHKTPNCYASLSFCTWYFQANKMHVYSMEYSCIKSINASYEEKVASNKRSRGLDEYRTAQREARGETPVSYTHLTLPTIYSV